MDLTLLSPAKLNLFLTITGKREDGYHNLQTIFQFVEFGDWMRFTLKPAPHSQNLAPQDSENLKSQAANLSSSDLPFTIQYVDDYSLASNNSTKIIKDTLFKDTIIKTSEYVNKQVKQLKESDPTKNLIYCAAKALVDFIDTEMPNFASGELPFVEISINKKIPLEAGLGGGSSNAATTLLALNKVWNLNLSNQKLAEIGLSLGADVPIFIYGHAAFAEGVGEKLVQVEAKESWYLLVYPNLGVSTASLFSSKELNRNSPIRTFEEWKSTDYYNDFEPIARKLYSAVNDGFNWLAQFGKPRMTGTGSTLFLDFASKEAAIDALENLPNNWWAVIAKGANHSPVHKNL